MRHPAALCLALAWPTALAQTQPGGFHLERLPRGKNVTIPRPATTYVPLFSRIQLTGTDLPQSLSFRPISPRAGGGLAPVKVAIYDQNRDRVVHAQIQPGTPFIYNFKDLRPITVVSESTPGSPSALLLQVESNKPLDIAH